jgi:predicted membrane-bound spermidine synthase
MGRRLRQMHGSPELSLARGFADRPHLRLFALSFLSLFLELTIIRWVPGSVRLVAYYANLMLISSFLGIGLGAMLAERGRRLVRWFPALLATDVLFLAVARHVLLPGNSVELRFNNTAQSVGITSYLALLGIFLLNAALFVPLGEQIGQQFRRLQNLRAYAWDLGGSLAGTLIFGVFAVAHFSPQIGLAIAIALFALLFPDLARHWRTIVLFAFVLGVSVVTTEWRATWSAYNHLSIRGDIDTWTMLSRAPTPPADLQSMQDPPSYMLSVNQNFYQYHRTIDIRRFTPGTPAYEATERFRISYLIPYAFQSSPRSVVVVGAGGGLDIESALLHRAEHVDAVEIDPAIIRLARRYSAAGVYGKPKVTLHVDDARAFFERATPGYDLVIFGLLDSHGLFSSMANIRLDGFVYTVEGFRAAWNLLNDRGVLSLAFGATSRPWLSGKLYRMAAEATGRQPRVYRDASTGNTVILVEKQPIEDPPTRFGGYLPWVPAAADLAWPAATDDWPYLYLRERTIPSDYLLAILSLLTISVVAVLRLKPRGAGFEELHFGAMGAGFLLLEVKSIVDSSLYFGATWIVSLIVISGVLLLVLLANTLAGRFRGFSRWLYAPLIGSILLIYAVPQHLVLGLPFAARVAWTALVVPLPIFFAGLVFSSTFKRTASPSAVFGANLVGAMVGGFAEYLSMAIGSRSLVVVVIGAYLVSLAAVSRTGRRAVVASA